MKIGAMNNPAIDLYKQITFIGKHDFDYLDLTLEPLKAYSENINIKRVKSLTNRYNLDIIGHTPWSLPIISPIKDIRKAAFHEFEKCLDIFKQLNVKYMNIHPGIPRQRIPEHMLLDLNIRFMQKIVKKAKKKGITVCLENLPGYFNDTDIFSYILKQVPWLRINLDIGHAFIGSPKRTEEFFSTFKKKIVHVHISDNKGNEDSHLPMGVGNINWKKQISILKRHKYDKTITLEIHTDDKSYLLDNKKKLEMLWRKK